MSVMNGAAHSNKGSSPYDPRHAFLRDSLLALPYCHLLCHLEISMVAHMLQLAFLKRFTELPDVAQHSMHPAFQRG